MVIILQNSFHNQTYFLFECYWVKIDCQAHWIGVGRFERVLIGGIFDYCGEINPMLLNNVPWNLLAFNFRSFLIAQTIIKSNFYSRKPRLFTLWTFAIPKFTSLPSSQGVLLHIIISPLIMIFPLQYCLILLRKEKIDIKIVYFCSLKHENSIFISTYLNFQKSLLMFKLWNVKFFY